MPFGEYDDAKYHKLPWHQLQFCLRLSPRALTARSGPYRLGNRFQAGKSAGEQERLGISRDGETYLITVTKYRGPGSLVATLSGVKSRCLEHGARVAHKHLTH